MTRMLDVQVHPSWRNKLVLTLLLTLLLLILQNAAVNAAQTTQLDRCDWSDQQYDDFYDPPPLGELTPERLGEVLRVEHLATYTPTQVAQAAGLPASDYGAEAYRILYLSQEPMGTPRAVSALIVVPTLAGSSPPEGFPVLVDGHGATGLSRQCAPSRNPRTPYLLLPWVAHGYMVSSTDYVGLGVAGPLHPFFVGKSEARSVLDSARSALRFCDSAHDLIFPASNRILLEGFSQGGHAVLFAHQEWEDYAPGLNLLGTVVFAPVSELRFLAQNMAGSRYSLDAGFFSVAMYSYTLYYGHHEPIQTWLKEPYATELPGWVENQCIITITPRLGFQPHRVFQPDVLIAMAEGSWDDLQPWTEYMDANTPGNYTSAVPVLVVHAEEDLLVPLEASAQLTKRLCEHGTQTRLISYPGLGHSVPKIARDYALSWIADRLAGLPPHDSCAIPVAYLPLVSR